jgi:aminopeptidase N
VIINNLEVEVKHEDNFIYLPRSCLQKGKNRVSVLYDNEYNIDFSGLISFTDNGEQFLFTDFEPYYANRVFPCFDQPNLKAKMILTVIAPSKWKVLSHERPPPAEQFTQEKYLQKAEWNHEKSRHLLSKFS